LIIGFALMWTHSLDISVYNGLPPALPSFLAIVSDVPSSLGRDREVSNVLFFGLQLLMIIVLG